MSMKTFLATGAVILPVLAFAHSATTGPNGGPQVDVGNFHVEYTAVGSTMTFHVRDHDDRPVPTEGFRGTVIFVIDGKAQRLTLQPAGENRMIAIGAMTAPPRPKGAVQIQTPSGANVSGRFN